MIFILDCPRSKPIIYLGISYRSRINNTIASEFSLLYYFYYKWLAHKTMHPSVYYLSCITRPVFRYSGRILKTAVDCCWNLINLLCNTTNNNAMSAVYTVSPRNSRLILRGRCNYTPVAMQQGRWRWPVLHGWRPSKGNYTVFPFPPRSLPL